MQQGSTICVDPATTALIVVDMQNDFCSADGYYASVGRDISQLAACAAPVSALLARARQAGMTVAFTRLLYDEKHGSMEDRHTIRPRRWTASGKRLMPGTRGANVIDAIAPRNDEIILDKTGYSAFEGTGLEQQLRERKIKTVIMAGVVTYACVLATAFSAFDRGFDVILATDAVGSWKEDLGVKTADIVDLLLGVAVPASEIEFGAASAS
jgi:nicotinamidase-related amidase